MFNKIKSFSEDVAKSFNEIQQGDPLKKNGDLIEKLRNSLVLLNKRTPDVGELTQPTDEEPAVEERYAPLPEKLSNLESSLTQSPLADSQNEKKPSANETGTLEGDKKTLEANIPSQNALQDINMDELAPLVRSKLKKFAKYEEKYPMLLDAYKTEKKKGELIRAFEKIMSEVTPVLSISDVALLVDYLKGLTEKATLLSNELRRSVSEASKLKYEKEDLHKKFTESQKIIQAAEESLGRKSKIEDEYRSNIKQLEAKILALEAEIKNSAQSSEVPPADESNENNQKLKDKILIQENALEIANKNLVDTKVKFEAMLKETQETMQKRLDSVTKDVEIKTSQHEESKKSQEALSNEISKLRKDLEDAQDLTQDYKDRLTEVQESLHSKETSEKKSEDLTQDLISARKIIEELEANLGFKAKEFDEKFSILQEENQKLRLAGDQAAENASSTAAKIESLEESLQIKSVETRAISADLERSKKELAQVSAKEMCNANSPCPPSKSSKKKKSNKKNKGSSPVVFSVSETNSAAEAHDAFEKEIAQLSAQLEVVVTEKTTLLSEVDQLKQSLEEKDNHILQFTEKLSINVEECTQLKKDLKKKEELLESAKKENSDTTELQNDLRASRRELDEKSEDLEQLRDLLREVGNELVSVKETMKEAKQKWISQHENELTDLKKKEISLSNLMKFKEAEFSKELAEKILEIKTLTATNEKLLKKHEDEIIRLNADLDQVQEKFTSAKSKLAEVQKLMSKKEEELSNVKKNYNALETEKKKLEERIEQLSKFKSADSSLKLEIASLQTSISHKDEQIKDLKDSLERKGKERDELTDTILSLKKTNGELHVTNQRFTDEKSKILGQQQSAIERANALAEEVANLQESRQKIVTELDGLKLKHEALQRTRVNVSDEILEYKQQNEELATKSKESQKKIDDLQDELFDAKNLLQERTRESTTLRRMLLEAEEAHTLKCNELRGEMRGLSEEQAETEANFQLLMKKRQREIEELKHICERYVVKIGELEKTCEEVRRKYEPLKDSKHHTSFEDLQKQKDLENLVDELRASLHDSSKKVKDYEKLNGILKKLNEESTLKFERLSKNYKHMTHQYRQMKESHDRNGAAAKIDEEAKPAAIRSPETNVAYLKNVLVGFLEHKEQREQLLPVLKMLFQFDTEEERKLMLALR